MCGVVEQHSPGKFPEKCCAGVAVNCIAPAFGRLKKLCLEHLKEGGGHQA